MKAESILARVLGARLSPAVGKAMGRLLLFLPLGLALVGCSIHAPEIRVTGERSALERQVLGSYQRFSEDLWMLGSYRSPGDTIRLAEERISLLKSVRRRQFNRDDRMRLLELGWVGEAADGMLVARPEAELSGDSDHELRERLLRQENEDRRRILARLLALNPGSEDELRRIFAGIQRDESPKGAWIQDEGGRWRRK